MDVLAELLDGARARGGCFHRLVVEPPWGLLVRDEAPLSLYTVLDAPAWIVHPEVDPVRVEPGDVAVVRGPTGYLVADDPATPPSLVAEPGDVCTTADGVSVCDELALGVRTWGADGDGSVVVVNGTYRPEGDVSARLLAALPPVVVVRDDPNCRTLLPLLAEEIGRDAPGQQAVLDRLLDLVLIATLRAWFDRPEAAAPAWYRAQGDPVVGPALRLLHADPARPWTVASLASAVGVSRAALARRFAELVGETPMAYLADWRMDIAADLLRTPGHTVASVARRVGYANAFALSSAFKRLRGVSPREYRAALTTPTDQSSPEPAPAATRDV
ncbi:AraC family transcriptional regulator [Streptomyces alkaliterrae]|uniref:AraC family transcriptional regulator n=1 Tax=Streptomyces alkaliterrae TaxID=2213162 RepID=A0A5P0YJ58_9ACTN|nr:AraC family transcriptional regulator [Streptomyces alkaliterrae]MBB1252029.1 AraC family transcriptional regulator [Streptomyces alkaliterrae]MBB1257466.1 AraC family transcriptional regulator [Streptomyces alkaliterrae]MQS00355.1 helix-turn-helix domain-containing protein [Streptomyces alkaliterrae]